MLPSKSKGHEYAVGLHAAASSALWLRCLEHDRGHAVYAFLQAAN